MNKPTFIGIGAQKAATTWIYDVLADHPDVGLSESKEVDFFSRHFDKGYQWYERQFVAEDARKAYGEISPSYLNEPGVPPRVAAYLPHVKIIVSLREPIARAISNHKHEVRVGHLAGADVSFETGLQNNPSYVDQGRYATHLRRWLEFFPREQVLVVLYDDIRRDPQAVAQAVYRFLGIAPDFVSAALHTPSNVGHLKRHPGLDTLRRQLRLGLKRLGGSWLWEGAARLGVRKLYRSVAWVESEDRIPVPREETLRMLGKEFAAEIEALEQMIDRPLAGWTKRAVPSEAAPEVGPKAVLDDPRVNA
jgi:hypothetical protein